MPGASLNIAGMGRRLPMPPVYQVALAGNSVSENSPNNILALLSGVIGLHSSQGKQLRLARPKQALLCWLHRVCGHRASKQTGWRLPAK
jgi:hypothetical protein